MNVVGKILASTILLSLICASASFSCDWGFCDADYVQDMNRLNHLSCDCLRCSSTFARDVSGLCANMYPPSCAENKGGLQRFRQDIKGLLRFLCKGRQCSYRWKKNVQILIGLMCNQTECSLECSHEYPEIARRLIQLASGKSGKVILIGTPESANNEKTELKENRILIALTEIDPSRFKSLRMTLAAGQVARVVCETNTSPLMLAAAMGKQVLVEKLVQKVKNVNARNKMGKTALIFAASEGHPKAVKALLKSGADPHLKDKDGATAADLATKAGHKHVAKILEEAAAVKE
jgi:hypothetical protein